MNEIDDKKYGVPEQKKFPMPDAAHVRSAIKFFNYVKPRYEKELANAILARMQEYGMSFEDFTVGEENRFRKYITELKHHGIIGQKWGVRRFQNADRTLTEEGKKRYAKKQRKLDEKEVRSSYKKAKYGKAVTEDFKNKGDTDNAARSAKYQKQLAKDAKRKYNEFIDKYGDSKVSDLKFEGNDVVLNGELEVNRLLYESSLKSVAINAIIPFGPLGWVIGGAVGVKHDSERRRNYEQELRRDAYV